MTYREQTEEEKALLPDLIRVAEVSPKIAALTIINLRAIIHDMEDYKVSTAHADDIVERMRSAYLG